MATIVAFCIIGGEVLAFLATIATIQLIAKPRLRRYRQQLGLASKRKKRAIKKRALKRLRSKCVLLLICPSPAPHKKIL